MDEQAMGERAEDELDRKLAEFLELREQDVAFEDWLRAQGEAAAQLRERYDRYRRIEGVLDRALPPLEVFSAFFHRRRAGSPGSSWEERPLDLKAGDELGEFRLVARLGRGGMGEVWEVEQRNVGRRVALKLMVPRDDGGRRASRFDLEPIALGRLSHPGIVAVFATGESDGVRWIAQELVQGGSTLEDFIRESRVETRPRDFDQRVAELFVTLADALQHVHGVGVLHRDVKPRNILVTPQGEPKLADFGLARVSDDQSLSESRHLLGTVPYMSPEQVGGEELDSRSDVFSLGVVLYEVLTGARPFHGDSQGQLMLRIANAEPLDARAHRRDIDPDLAAICAKAIEKLPGERYQTAGALADDLVRFVRGEPTHARPAGPLRRARKWLRRHRSVLASVAAVLAVGLPLSWWAVDARAGRVEAQKLGLLESAQGNFLAADVDAAIADVERAIALDPEDPTGYVVLAIGLTGANRFIEARERLRDAVELGVRPYDGPFESFTDHMAYGIAAFLDVDTERYDEAVEHLDIVATGDWKLRALAWNPIYQLERASGHLPEALEALERYLESVPSRSPTHAVLLAEKHELLGQTDEALEQLDRLEADARLDAQDRRRFMLDGRRGRILTAAGRWREAAEALERDLERRPDDAVSLANLARAQYELGRAPDTPAPQRSQLAAAAESSARAAVEADDSRVEAWTLLGRIALDRLADANPRAEPGESPDWQRVETVIAHLDRDPRGARSAHQLEWNLHNQRAMWCAELDEQEGLIEALERLVELDPTDLARQLELGSLLVQHEEYARAIRPLLEARRLQEAASVEVPDGDRAALLLRLFAAASNVEKRVELAREARAELLELVDADAIPDPLVVAHFAYYLAGATVGEVRDCELARELLADLADLADLANDLDLDDLGRLIEERCR